MNSCFVLHKYTITGTSTYKEYEIEESEEDLGEARSAVGHHGEEGGRVAVSGDKRVRRGDCPSGPFGREGSKRPPRLQHPVSLGPQPRPRSAASSLLFPIVQIRHRSPRAFFPSINGRLSLACRKRPVVRGSRPLGTPTLASINRTSIHQAKFAFKRGAVVTETAGEGALIAAAPVPGSIRRLRRASDVPESMK